jgi:hypothetical protein
MWRRERALAAIMTGAPEVIDKWTGDEKVAAA